MEKSITRNQIVEKACKKYQSSIIAYINRKIHNYDDAEDMTQDLFIRLLNYDQLICIKTLKSLLFIMAHNMVTDYFRHHARLPYVDSYTLDVINKSNMVTPLEELYVNNLEDIEVSLMDSLSPKCRRVYYMTRIEGKSIDEISTELNVSPRTIERQQCLSRKNIRERLRKII